MHYAYTQWQRNTHFDEKCVYVYRKKKKTATAKHNYSNDIFFLLFPHKNFLSCVRKPEIDLFIENGGYIRV